MDDVIKNLVKKNDSKIIMLVMDGLGGLPTRPDGQTELETASTPNLDALARTGICGLHTPVANGIIPGSGPAHLGLFGYDPLKYEVGRGVLAALGTGFDLQPNDVAARGNFCTLDNEGQVTDRRAGRIETELCEELTAKLQKEVKLSEGELFVRPVKEYRFLVVLRGGKDLSGKLADTDPQQTGRPPLEPKANSLEADKTAHLVAEFVEQAQKVLSDQDRANGVLLRGFSQQPDWPDMEERYGVKAGAIAAYPMYRGVAKLIGMDLVETGQTVAEEFETLHRRLDDYDFIYIHVKKIDSAGEDGDFDRKVKLIEEVDQFIPDMMKLAPDVVVVTGDHSTPSVMKSHSWHPVPAILWGQYCRQDHVEVFGERACMTGGLGSRLPATDLMTLALANAGRLDKFGA